MPRSRSFRAITYPLAGGSYKDGNSPLSQQRTLNMYLEQTKSGRVDNVLKSWPGLKLWSSGDSVENDRGIYERLFKGFAYQVSGSTLYRISSLGVKTSVGSIAGGDQVTMTDNDNVLVIVGGNQAYEYDGVTLSTRTHSFTPTTVDYLNNQFVYGSLDGRVYISTAGLTTVISGNSFSPDSSPDSLVRPYVFDQFLLNFNERSIEPWENTGQGIPPFERMDGVIQEDTGLAGKDAVANSSSAVYFLGSDNEPYQMVNFQTRKIGDAAVSREMQSYGDNQDCRVHHVSFKAQDFVIWSFPLVGKTWLYSEQTQIWSELDHDADGKRYLGNSTSRLFDKNLIGDYSSGNIYELDDATYQNNGVLIARERTARPLSGEQFDNPRQRVQFSELTFSVDTGVGNPNETNPLLQTTLSTDGVKFGDEIWHELGREGEYQQDIKHSTNKNCTDMVVRLRCTDNCAFSIFTAGALIREAGR
jgi:hypothetical protein